MVHGSMNCKKVVPNLKDKTLIDICFRQWIRRGWGRGYAGSRQDAKSQRKSEDEISGYSLRLRGFA
jgi:hypothetical protein